MFTQNQRLVSDKTVIYPNLLLERLGDDFFNRLPSDPGVYWMLDLVGNILYIGQAQDLRKSLTSYTRATDKNVSPIVMHLVYHTTQIEWETCDTPEAARLLEDQLLRSYNPPYNQSNTRHEKDVFAGFEVGKSEFRFAISSNLDLLNLENRYGAFKSAWSLRQLYSSLLRALWFGTHSSSDHTKLPMALMHKQPPDTYEISFPDTWNTLQVKRWEYLIKRYLKGTAQTLVDELADLAGDPNHPPESFLEHLARNDLQELKTCYDVVTHRQYQLIKHNGIQGTIILQEDLDDLIISNPEP